MRKNYIIKFIISVSTVLLVFASCVKKEPSEFDLHYLFEYGFHVTDNVFSAGEVEFLISVEQLLEEKELDEEAIYSRENTGSYESAIVINDVKTMNLSNEMREIYRFFDDKLITVEYSIPVTDDERALICQIIYDQVMALNLTNQTNFSLEGLKDGTGSYTWEDEKKNTLSISCPTTLENEPDIIMIGLHVARESVLSQVLVD